MRHCVKASPTLLCTLHPRFVQALCFVARLTPWQGYDALSEESDQEPPSPRVLLHQLGSSSAPHDPSVSGRGPSVSGRPPAGRKGRVPLVSREVSGSGGTSAKQLPPSKPALREQTPRSLLKRTSQVCVVNMQVFFFFSFAQSLYCSLYACSTEHHAVASLGATVPAAPLFHTVGDGAGSPGPPPSHHPPRS